MIIVAGVLVWINGPFGVGKTAVAHELVRRAPGAVLVDPERVGSGLQHALPPAYRVDYQDLASWRAGVVEVLDLVLRRHRGPVVVPMTVVVPAYLDQTVGALRALGHDVHHVTLLAERDTVERRLRRRAVLGVRREEWTLAQLPRCLGALGDERFARHLDTTTVGVDEVVEDVAAAAGVVLAHPADRPFVGRLRRRLLSVRDLRVG